MDSGRPPGPMIWRWIPVLGSKISAVARISSTVLIRRIPPTISTRPSSSRVAVCPKRPPSCASVEHWPMPSPLRWVVSTKLLMVPSSRLKVPPPLSFSSRDWEVARATGGLFRST
jgi:hypothetical protein